MRKLNNVEDLEKIFQKDKITFIYFYTMMCGTCQLARKFLEIVENMEDIPEVYEMDVNFFKDWTKEWQIKSVPCLVAVCNKEVLDKLYAFESVTNVYQFMKRK